MIGLVAFTAAVVDFNTAAGVVEGLSKENLELLDLVGVTVVEFVNEWTDFADRFLRTTYSELSSHASSGRYTFAMTRVDH